MARISKRPGPLAKKRGKPQLRRERQSKRATGLLTSRRGQNKPLKSASQPPPPGDDFEDDVDELLRISKPPSELAPSELAPSELAPSELPTTLKTGMLPKAPRPPLKSRAVAEPLAEDEIAVDIEEDPPSRHTGRPVARTVRPPAGEEQPRGKAFFLLAAVMLGATALWVFSSRQEEQTADTVAKPSVVASETDMARAPGSQPGDPTTVAAGEEAAAADESADERTESLDDEASGAVVAPATPTPVRRVVKSKPAPTPAPEPAEPPGEFSREDVNLALSDAAKRASSCRQSGDPTGVARVKVTFAPSGRVTSATISGPPFVGTETGSCIARTMQTMSIPAFEGQHVTVQKTVTIM